MKKQTVITILSVALVFLMIGAYALYALLGEGQTPGRLSYPKPANGGVGEQPQNDSTDTQGSERQDVKAMDFTVYDADGRAVTLSEYIGKPIVLNFWASWCGPCQQEMPDFHEVYLELGEEVHFLMVNITGGRETLASATGFISQKGYTFPVFYDTAADATQTYQVYSLPTTYFIDADGYLIAQAIGPIDVQTLQRGIDMIR